MNISVGARWLSARNRSRCWRGVSPYSRSRWPRRLCRTRALRACQPAMIASAFGTAARLLMGWPGRAQRLICRTEAGRREARLKEHAMRTSQKTAGIITTIGIDLGKNTFHLIGFDQRGAIILQQKVSRGQLERRLANIPLPDRHGSLFGFPSHRPAVASCWSRCASDPGAIREAVPQGSQERLPRCRGDCGSRATTDHAFCGDQDARADGSAGSASRALAVANKLARIAWAVLARGRAYQPRITADAA